jgi:hypothetical protein
MNNLVNIIAIIITVITEIADFGMSCNLVNFPPNS